MDRYPVASSNIISVGHDPETLDLEIEFKGGAVYRYARVPADAYEYFIGSGSLGRHFALHIKKQFECKRVELMPVLVAGEPCHGEAS